MIASRNIVPYMDKFVIYLTLNLLKCVVLSDMCVCVCTRVRGAFMNSIRPVRFSVFFGCYNIPLESNI